MLEKCCVLNSKQELLREENKYIEHSLGDPKCLNSNRAIENLELNKIRDKQYNKTYYEQHKEEQQQRNEDYAVSHKEERRLYHKQFLEMNKDPDGAVSAVAPPPWITPKWVQMVWEQPALIRATKGSLQSLHHRLQNDTTMAGNSLGYFEI